MSSSIILAAIGGALGGLIGSLLGRKLKNKNAKLVATIIPIVIFSRFLPEILKGTELMDKLFPKSNVEASLQNFGDLAKNQSFLKATKGMSNTEVAAFTQQSTRLGLKRLPIHDIKEWNQLRLKLAAADSNLCAGFWTGKGMSTDKLVNALNSLAKADTDAWFRISMNAARLEIEQVPFTAPPDGALQDGLKAIMATLNSGDADRFLKVMSSGTEAEDNDACWGMKIIFTSIQSMVPTEQESVLRALASL